MSEQQEGASGEPQGSMGEHIFYKLKDALDRIPQGGRVAVPMHRESYESIHKLRADALAEQVEKLRVRRDSWRERCEQAQADLEEHRKGREVLAELMAHNPVALQLQRERDDLSDALRKARVAQTRAELRRDWWSLAAAMGFGYIVVDLARAVLP